MSARDQRDAVTGWAPCSYRYSSCCYLGIVFLYLDSHCQWIGTGTLVPAIAIAAVAATGPRALLEYAIPVSIACDYAIAI